MRLLKRGAPPEGEEEALDFSEALGSYRIDIYDRRARLVAASTNVEEEAHRTDEPVVESAEFEFRAQYIVL